MEMDAATGVNFYQTSFDYSTGFFTMGLAIVHIDAR